MPRCAGMANDPLHRRGGPYIFPNISFRVVTSSICSASSFFSRAFSSSRLGSRRASETSSLYRPRLLSPDVAVALQEMARVLRPGGRLVVGDLGKWSFWAARRRIRGWLGTQFWRAARFRTAHQLSRLVTDTGLVVVSTRGAIFFPPWRPAARLMAPIDAMLGRFTTLGAAFIALQATRPG